MKHQHDNSVLETLIANHPLVKKLKLEAKKYKKENAHTGLMQAQSYIAQQKGFHNWHDFLQKIKLLFNHEFKHNKLISAQKGIVPEQAYLHLGKSQSYGLEQWINQAMLKTHLSIFDTSLNLDSPDMYFAQQIIEKKESLVFISECLIETQYLAQKAIDHGLSEHLYIIDYTQSVESRFHDYLASFNVLECQSSGALTEIIFNLVSQQVDFEQYDEYLKGRIFSFISTFMMALNYTHLEKQQTIQWTDLMVNVIDYLHTHYSSFPLHLQHIIENYFENVGNDTGEKIQTIYLKTLEQYYYLQEQKKRGFSLFKSRENHQPYISLILLPQRTETNTFLKPQHQKRFYSLAYFQIYCLFFSYIKSVMAFELGTSIEENYSEVWENKRQKDKALFIMRDIYTPAGCSVLPAQMRSSNIGLVFSYSTKLHDESYPEEKQNLLLNTNLKIFSHDIEQSSLREYYDSILKESQWHKDYSFMNQGQKGEYYLYHLDYLNHRENIQVLKIIHD